MKLLRVTLLATLLFGTGAALAASHAGPPPAKAGEVYGHRLMTAEEHKALHDKMMGAKTPEERDRMCTEHHEAMQARAKERGVNLPEHPMMKEHRMKGGMGPGRMGGMCGMVMGDDGKPLAPKHGQGS